MALLVRMRQGIDGEALGDVFLHPGGRFGSRFGIEEHALLEPCPPDLPPHRPEDPAIRLRVNEPIRCVHIDHCCPAMACMKRAMFSNLGVTVTIEVTGDSMPNRGCAPDAVPSQRRAESHRETRPRTLRPMCTPEAAAVGPGRAHPPLAVRFQNH